MFGGLIGYTVGHITTGLPNGYTSSKPSAHLHLLGRRLPPHLSRLPPTAKFLTPYERLIAVSRVAANRQGVKNHNFQPHQAIQTIQDPKTWILFVMAVGAQVPNSALTSITSIIVASFGFDTLGTQHL